LLFERISAVLNSLFDVSSSTHLIRRFTHLTHPTVGVALLAGLSWLTVFVNAGSSAHSIEVPANFSPHPLSKLETLHSIHPVTPNPEITTSQTSHVQVIRSHQATHSQPIEDGIYLYGQSPERDQIGSAYMVFEVTQGEVIGAFYMPRSSFDCFYGNLQADRIALTVIDSYERTPHPYAVALEPADTLATTESGVTPVGLEGFHAIDSPSENDLQILSTCRADFQSRLGSDQ
jgi:hypothetical protein